jgi:hypothetical protein
MISGGAGMPAYTVPPASSATPFGVSGSAQFGHPFGVNSAPTAQVDLSVQAFEQESPASHGLSQGVPQQRMQGTVYGTGGYAAIDTTMPVSLNPVETSGSLTGHILAQGWHDEIVDRRRSNVKVVVAMLVVLGLLVTVSLVFLLTAGNAFTDMLKNMGS